MTKIDWHKIDWLKIDASVVRSLFNQAEKRLDGQTDVALAADARALSILSLFFGVASALLAYAILKFSERGADPLVASAFLSSFLLFVSCALIAYSARPVNFYVSGTEPKNWFECLESPETVIIGGECGNYDEMIAENENIIAANERSLRRGIYTALTTPALAVATYLIFWSVMV